MFFVFEKFKKFLKEEFFLNDSICCQTKNKQIKKKLQKKNLKKKDLT